MQEKLGLYTEKDDALLNAALCGYEMCRLKEDCRDRVVALRAVSEGMQLVKSFGDVRTDKATFLLLAYACCINHTHWFVKHEVRYLMAKVAALTASEKVLVLGLLQVATRLSTEYESLYCVDFEHATRLVAARSVTVRNGSVYLQQGQLGHVIREAYETRLVLFLKKCKQRFEEIGRTNTAYYAPQYGTVLTILQDIQHYVCPVLTREFVSLEYNAQTLSAAVAKFAPLCITKLVLKLRIRRHLIDKERVTLRLWLHAIRVKLDVAVEFWSQHVNEKEDVRSPIAQAYAKQYACMGCTKIRSQGLCPFEDADKTILTWCSDTMPSALPDMEDILQTSTCALERCGRVFRLRHERHGSISRSLTGPRNPANYFLRASDSGLL